MAPGEADPVATGAAKNTNRFGGTQEVQDAAPAASPHLGNALPNYAPFRLSVPLRPRYGLDRMRGGGCQPTIRPPKPFNPRPLNTRPIQRQSNFNMVRFKMSTDPNIRSVPNGSRARDKSPAYQQNHDP